MKFIAPASQGDRMERKGNFVMRRRQLRSCAVPGEVRIGNDLGCWKDYIVRFRILLV